MCQGMNFCTDCQNDPVRAWSDGHIHQLAGFGDGAQQYTATKRRQFAIELAVIGGNVEVIKNFPEFRSLTRRFTSISPNPTNLNEVYRHLPGRPYSHRRPPQKNKRRNELAAQAIASWMQWQAPKVLTAEMQRRIVAPPVLQKQAA